MRLAEALGNNKTHPHDHRVVLTNLDSMTAIPFDSDGEAINYFVEKYPYRDICKACGDYNLKIDDVMSFLHCQLSLEGETGVYSHNYEMRPYNELPERPKNSLTSDGSLSDEDEWGEDRIIFFTVGKPSGTIVQPSR